MVGSINNDTGNSIVLNPKTESNNAPISKNNGTNLIQNPEILTTPKIEIKAHKVSADTPVLLAFNLTTNGEKMSTLKNFVSSNNDPKVTKAFESLKSSGRLELKDTKGKTILDNLYSMINENPRNFQSDVSQGQLIEDSILVLSDRKYITQGGHGTCGAASLQNLLWEKAPGEMLRMVKDLATNGQVVLRGNSHTMGAGKNSMTTHESDRRDFCTIFQSAVMKDCALVGGNLGKSTSLQNNFARLFPITSFGSEAQKKYNSVQYDVTKDDGAAVSTGNSAANPELVSKLYSIITGDKSKRFQSVIENANPFNNVFNGFTNSVANGSHPIVLFDTKGGPVVGNILGHQLKQPFKWHYVQVQKIENGFVYFLNSATTSKDNQKVEQISTEEFKGKFKGFIG